MPTNLHPIQPKHVQVIHLYWEVWMPMQVSNKSTLFLEFAHDTFNNRWVNSSSIFAVIFSDFQNPFNFDYKIDSRKSGGFRSVFKHDLNMGKQHVEINFGTEYQKLLAIPLGILKMILLRLVYLILMIF